MKLSTNCCNQYRLESLATTLVDGLRAELYLTPKPGLVDLANSGSHSDLNLELMNRSISLLRGYLDELCAALAAGHSLAELVPLGRRAEARMFAETGTNCHRGGIFLCGLLLTAVTRIDDPSNTRALRLAVAEVAAEFFRARAAEASHGNRVRLEYPRSGIVAEALDGLPALFDTFLPAMAETGVAKSLRPFLAMARLMQVVEDSTSLHRCGQAGLDTVKRAGAMLESVICHGHSPYRFLDQLDSEFRCLNLTMGGVADILGLGFGYYSFRSSFVSAAAPAETRNSWLATSSPAPAY